MANDILVEERAYGLMDARQVRKQMVVIQDLMSSVFREGEHLSSRSDLAELAEPPFIRRSTCFDLDCRAMRAGYIFL